MLIDIGVICHCHISSKGETFTRVDINVERYSEILEFTQNWTCVQGEGGGLPPPLPLENH
jgi:hypothetical protein